MQAAQPPNPFVAGTQIQVVGVAKQNLHAQFSERLLREALHRTGCAHRHEGGRIDHAVRRRQPPEPRAGRIGLQNFEMEFHPIQFSRAMRHRHNSMRCFRLHVPEPGSAPDP